jgi:23S rRNA (cytosine1962-C5)-methyltransferase
MSRREARVVVNGYSERWLRQGFPWVYPNEVVKGRGAGPGRWVGLYSSKGKRLGHGLWDEGWIAARVIPDDLVATLDAAADHRELVVDDKTSGFRLLHGENDGLPGVRIDWWSHFAVIILDSPSLAPLIVPITNWLRQRREPRGIYLCYRPDPRDKRDWRSLDPAPGLIDGHAPPGDVTIVERGLSLLVRPADGPDVGVYADMRMVRAWMEDHWGGRRVLNTFSYTGAFSVAAAMGGATEVTSVDLSASSLERAEANFRANGLDPSLHDFCAEDTFKAMDRFRRKGELFDVVILDPPSFSRGTSTWSAKRDYPRLVSAACRVLAPGGWILAASNQGKQSPKDFQGLVANGVRKAERSAQEIHWAGAGPDFPAACWFPEGHYLKVGIWRVL